MLVAVHCILVLHTAETKRTSDAVKQTVEHGENNGGPDNFGYTWVNSKNSSCEDFDWVNTNMVTPRLASGRFYR